MTKLLPCTVIPGVDADAVRAAYAKVTEAARALDRYRHGSAPTLERELAQATAALVEAVGVAFDLGPITEAAE